MDIVIKLLLDLGKSVLGLLVAAVFALIYSVIFLTIMSLFEPVIENWHRTRMYRKFNTMKERLYQFVIKRA